MKLEPPSPGEIRRVEHLALKSTAIPWPLAVEAAGTIANHWQTRIRDNPAFFDGQVLVLRELEPSMDGFAARMSLERFSTFLYWRDHPATDPGIWDGFVTAIVRSAEGHIMLARHAEGTLNGGHWSMPGGFLDACDLLSDGDIDLEGAARRELAEETGLLSSSLERKPGYLVTRHHHACSFGIELQSRLSSAALSLHLEQGLDRQGRTELTAIEMLSSLEQLATLPVLPHARLIARFLLGASA